jgi:hypothetical protein
MSKKVQVALVKYVATSDYEGYTHQSIQLPDHMVDWMEVDVEDLPKIKQGLQNFYPAIYGKNGYEAKFLLIEKLDKESQLGIIQNCIERGREQEKKQMEYQEKMSKKEKMLKQKRELRSKIRGLQKLVAQMETNIVSEHTKIAIDEMNREIEVLNGQFNKLKLKNM